MLSLTAVLYYLSLYALYLLFQGDYRYWPKEDDVMFPRPSHPSHELDIILYVSSEGCVSQEEKQTLVLGIVSQINKHVSHTCRLVYHMKTKF